MNRFTGLIRDTWLLWIVLLTGGILLGTFVDPVLFAAIPISIFAFIYFGLMRYGDDGKPKGDG